MHCPYCGAGCEAQDRFCSQCGEPLETFAQEKKGRHWVPILIMAILLAFGTGLFFGLPGTTSGIPGNSDEQMPWFQIEGGVLSFDESRYDGNGELVIPKAVGGTPVTALADGCFENCTMLTSITLPPTLEAIGEDAFRGCTALRGIEIPESVALVGAEAFSGCTSLEAVCIFDNLQMVGEGAFSGCTKLFYIYYSGYFQDWNKLYGEFINPYTTVFSQDGTFYQGEAAN